MENSVLFFQFTLFLFINILAQNLKFNILAKMQLELLHFCVHLKLATWLVILFCTVISS